MQPDSTIPRAKTAIRVAQPVVASAVTWAGPRVLGAAYRAGTGRTPPTIRSSRYSVLSRVAWSMAVAGVVALTEALVIRAIGGDDSDETEGPEAPETLPPPVTGTKPATVAP